MSVSDQACRSPIRHVGLRSMGHVGLQWVSDQACGSPIKHVEVSDQARGSPIRHSVPAVSDQPYVGLR